MRAIANALDGLSRAEAARLAGMERQALRDAAVVRDNAEEGLAGLHDRPKPGRPPRPDEGASRPPWRRGSSPTPTRPGRDGVAAWTRADLGR